MIKVADSRTTPGGAGQEDAIARLMRRSHEQGPRQMPSRAQVAGLSRVDPNQRIATRSFLDVRKMRPVRPSQVARVSSGRSVNRSASTRITTSAGVGGDSLRLRVPSRPQVSVGTAHVRRQSVGSFKSVLNSGNPRYAVGAVQRLAGIGTLGYADADIDAVAALIRDFRKDGKSDVEIKETLLGQGEEHALIDEAFWNLAQAPDSTAPEATIPGGAPWYKKPVILVPVLAGGAFFLWVMVK